MPDSFAARLLAAECRRLRASTELSALVDEIVRAELGDLEPPERAEAERVVTGIRALVRRHQDRTAG